jgi:hypothetical protein
VVAVRKEIFIAVFLLFSLPAVMSSGLGIWPAEVNITVSPLRTSHTTIYLFNPDITDSDVQIYFQFDGTGENIPASQFIGSVEPEEITVEKNTTMYKPEEIVLVIKNPLFIKKTLIFDLLGREQKLFYYEPIIGSKMLEGRLFARTINTKVSIVLTSEVNIELKGFGRGGIIFILSFVTILLFMFLPKTKKK